MGYTPRFPILLKLGLSEGEAEIFESLVEGGTQKARDLVEKSTQGRGNVYNLLNSLIAKGLVLEISGTQKRYQAVDPTHLKTLLDKKKEETHRLEHEFSESLGTLSSLFTLSTGKPAIQIFEGIEGGEEAVMDSLTTSGEILTIINPAALVNAFQVIDERYGAKQEKMGIPKRTLLLNSPETKVLAQTLSKPEQYRLLQSSGSVFLTAMKVYDNKVAYYTLTEQKNISVIIEDENIANIQRAQFEILWNQAAPLSSSSSTSEGSEETSFGS